MSAPATNLICNKQRLTEDGWSEWEEKETWWGLTTEAQEKLKSELVADLVQLALRFLLENLYLCDRCFMYEKWVPEKVDEQVSGRAGVQIQAILKLHFFFISLDPGRANF